MERRNQKKENVIRQKKGQRTKQDMHGRKVNLKIPLGRGVKSSTRQVNRTGGDRVKRKLSRRVDPRSRDGR